MSALKPGLWSATVYSVPGITVMVDDHGSATYVAGSGDLVAITAGAPLITDARPLIVLDLSRFAGCGDMAYILRDTAKRHREGRTGGYNVTAPEFLELVADQIEAQTKPVRIPEPGWDGKVLAHTESNLTRREFVRYGVRPIPTHFNWNDSLGFGAQQWGDLIDPTLIREGLS